MLINSAFSASLLLCVISAVAEGLIAGKNAKSFLQNLHAPRYAPPFRIWIVIGLLYYGMCFFISYRILGHWDGSVARITAFIVLMAVMAVNVAWNYIFFRAQDLRRSFLVFIPYGALAIALFVFLQRAETIAAWMFLPYMVYLIYAAFICYKYWRLNERHQQSLFLANWKGA